MGKIMASLCILAVGGLSYALGRWLRAAEAEPGPPVAGWSSQLRRPPERFLAAVATPTLSPSARRSPGPSAARIALPAELSALDQLALQEGHPAILLRSRAQARFTEWGNVARTACAPQAPMDPAEVALDFQIVADPATIRVDRISVTAHRGAPIAESTLTCIARALRVHEGAVIRDVSRPFTHFTGSVGIRLPLGDGRTCSPQQR